MEKESELNRISTENQKESVNNIIECCVLGKRGRGRPYLEDGCKRIIL